MRKREWMRCTDPYAMLREVDLPIHLMPDCPTRRKLIQLRRLRVFTLTAGQGSLARVNNAICHMAADVGWRLAEGTATPDEVATSMDALRAVYGEALAYDTWELARLVNVLVLLFSEPDGAAARTLINPQWSGQHLPLLTPDETRDCCQLLREVFGDRGWAPVIPDPSWQPAWLTSTVTALAQQMYESRDFGAMPILADALQDAGCDSDDILDHCRGPGPHVRGCWVIDLVLGKE